MGEPLGGAIFCENDQYWYQNDQWMILQRLVGVTKPYRKYFRFRATNHFSIFFPYLKSHPRSKIVRISWKFGQRRKMSQIIIIHEKKVFFLIFRLRKTYFFAFRANLWFDFSEIQQWPSKFCRKKNDTKISCRAPKVDRKLIFFTDKDRISLIRLLQIARESKANILK